MKNTFCIGGVHPHDNKSFSAHKPIVEAPLPKQAVILLSQHIGAPAQPVVAVGDKVKVGTLLAKAGGFVSAPVHSSVSGTVAKIDNVLDGQGQPAPAIYIDVEGDEWLPEIDRSKGLVHECTLEPKEIIQNGVECEPYLTNDHQLMLEHGEEIIVGIRIVMKALGVTRAIIGIEANKPDAIEHMQDLVSKVLGIEVRALKVKYPQGGEKQLIDACIGRQVPSGALPIETGAVVDNVATLYAIYEAVQKNKPLISRVMTITGKNVSKPGNYLVRFGTPTSQLVEMVGGLPAGTGEVIAGGPMMGRSMSNIDTMPANKRMSALLFMPEDECYRPNPSPCIRCAKCVDACPMGLEPYLLSSMAKGEEWEGMEKHRVMDCIDCGSCVFTCPAHRPLLDGIRLGKGKVGAMIRERQAAAKK